MKFLCYLAVILLAVTSSSLSAFEFKNPFVKEDVISCQIDDLGFFELRSKSYRQFSFNSHVSEYSVPEAFSVSFIYRDNIHIPIPYSINRGGNIELERELNYCDFFGGVGESYYFWIPYVGGKIFLLRPEEDGFVNVYPESMRESAERFNSNKVVFIWGINRVRFVSDRHIVVEQAGEYIDKGNCSLSSSLPVGQCFPAMVRMAESFDEGRNWTEPMIVSEPTQFILDK